MLSLCYYALTNELHQMLHNEQLKPITRRFENETLSHIKLRVTPFQDMCELFFHYCFKFDHPISKTKETSYMEFIDLTYCINSLGQHQKDKDLILHHR